jgi:hypothetical protein
MSPHDICRRPTHNSWVKVWDFKVQGPTLIGRVASAPLSPCSSQNDGELPFRRATSKPPLSKWLWVLKDAGLSHLSVPLLVKVSWGQQPWETLVVPVDPSGELDFAHPSHSRTTPVPIECCPLREWLLPLGKLRRDRF